MRMTTNAERLQTPVRLGRVRGELALLRGGSFIEPIVYLLCKFVQYRSTSLGKLTLFICSAGDSIFFLT